MNTVSSFHVSFPLRTALLLALVTLSVAPLARAHSVWIESTSDGKLVVRFGEPGDEFERSPDHLDSLTLPVAWTFDAEAKPAAFEVQKSSDHFLFVGADPAKSTFGETGFPVMKRGDNPATKPFFHMRWLPAGAVAAEAKPALTLDIVPSAESGAFRVFFRGAPLADVKVTVHAPDAEHELVADTEGVVRFTGTASGIYLLTANHREPVKCFAGGHAYDRVSHNVALTWRQP